MLFKQTLWNLTRFVVLEEGFPQKKINFQISKEEATGKIPTVWNFILSTNRKYGRLSDVRIRLKNWSLALLFNLVYIYLSNSIHRIGEWIKKLCRINLSVWAKNQRRFEIFEKSKLYSEFVLFAFDFL